jgi:pantoate--beta-alanine ligase
LKIFKSIPSLVGWRQSRSVRQKIGFVPTMGALHSGHAALIKQSVRENALTVVSIFVNPTQFGPKEDFSRYPRPWKKDVALIKKLGADVIFSPPADQMYAHENSTTVTVPSLNSVLCGAPTSRGSGHFNGVATVVSKLFHLVQPTRAYFGLKDFQQVRIIEQMVEDLNFNVQIVRCPTVREVDGLALSSRNQYLSPAERSVAPGFYVALQQGRKLLTSSRVRPSLVRQKVITALTSLPNSRVEYVELVDPKTLQKVRSFQRPLLLVAAIRLGKTRLIDNILIN